MSTITFTLASMALASSFLVQGTSAVRLPFLKRDSSTVTPLTTLDMPLHFDSNGRYMVPVTMSSNKPQNFNFTLSTATGYTYVAGTSCSDCTGIPQYNQGASSSASSLSGSDNTTLPIGSLSGNFIKEDCGAMLSNGSFWKYPNQTVINVNTQTSSILGDGISGIFGLGTNTVAGQNGAGFADTIYGQWLPRNPGHDNFTFGMMLNPAPTNPQEGSDAGVLHWTKPDPSFFKPDQVSTKTVQNNAAAGSSSSTSGNTTTSSGQDWTVPLDGWVATVGNTHLSNTQDVIATVDPLFPNIYLPSDQAKLIHDAINGSAQAPANASTLGGASQAFTIPCDAQFSFGLLVGTQTFVLNPDQVIIKQSDGTCVSAIEGFTDTSQTGYLVGSKFISTIYLIFNIPRDGPPTLGFSPRAFPSHGSNTGAIVGGTVGGVAGVIILGLVAFWYVRKRADRFRGPFEIEDASDKPVQHVGVEPFTLGAPTPAQPSTILQGSSTGANSREGSMAAQPLLLAMHDGLHEQQNAGLPPPSYEEASSSSGSPVTARPPRDVKGRPRAASGMTDVSATTNTTNYTNTTNTTNMNPNPTILE